MFDYAMQFYTHYTVIFYVLILITVILEGPITILFLSLLAPKLGISFLWVYIFAFLGEFLGDLAHYFVGRFFKKNIFKDKEFEVFKKFEKKLEHHSLLDKLVVIKYTPPITSIGLLYFGFQKIDFKKFMRTIVIFSLFNSILITVIGYNLGTHFVDKNDFKYIIIGLMLSFLLLYLVVKLISSYFVKKVLNEK